MRGGGRRGGAGGRKGRKARRGRARRREGGDRKCATVATTASRSCDHQYQIRTSLPFTYTGSLLCYIHCYGSLVDVIDFNKLVYYIIKFYFCNETKYLFIMQRSSVVTNLASLILCLFLILRFFFVARTSDNK